MVPIFYSQDQVGRPVGIDGYVFSQEITAISEETVAMIKFAYAFFFQ